MELSWLTLGLPLVTAYLYRWGGGDIWPFKKGLKAVRRYALPLLIAVITTQWLLMALFSVVLHFNLDEIEERDWDDVMTYGLAQSACFTPFLGWVGLLIGASWLFLVYWSNNGPKRIPWHYVEFIHGLVIGITIYCGVK